MSNVFDCPACHKPIAADGEADTQVRCPLCNEVVTIPAAAVRTSAPGLGGGAPGGRPQQGMAIAALACGIAGFFTCGLSGLLGIVLGIVALVQANSKPHRYGGKGLAIGGICTGGVSLIMVPLLVSILLPSLSRARELSKRLVCAANMKGIGTSMLIYAQDWDGQVPTFETLVASGEVSEEQFICPSSNAIIDDLHACYEVIPEAELLSDQPVAAWMYEKADNHGGEGGNVLFTDGHVEFIRPYSRVQELVAETKQRIAEAKSRAAGDSNGP